MKNHEMKLNNKYYNFILNGTKRIELRLYDEKRKLIELNDTITFFNDSDLSASFTCKVLGLMRFLSFEELFKCFDISLLSDCSMTKQELLQDLEKFYTKSKQKEYGVLGIKIELLNKKK